MQKRIDAPKRVIDAVNHTQQTIERLQAEIQAALFGAHAALEVPEGWQWDGVGWVSPEKESAATEE